MSGFAVEAEDGVLVPVLRNVDKAPLKELVAPLRRTRGTRAPEEAPAQRDGRLHRHRDKFRHVRPHMGHADSAARANTRARHGRGPHVPTGTRTKQFVPVTEANLTLSFDHRVLDGGGAGRLLPRIADLMSKPETL